MCVYIVLFPWSRNIFIPALAIRTPVTCCCFRFMDAAHAATRTLAAGLASCIVLASGAIAAPSVIEGPARVVDGDTLVSVLL